MTDTWHALIIENGSFPKMSSSCAYTPRMFHVSASKSTPITMGNMMAKPPCGLGKHVFVADAKHPISVVLTVNSVLTCEDGNVMLFTPITAVDSVKELFPCKSTHRMEICKMGTTYPVAADSVILMGRHCCLHYVVVVTERTELKDAAFVHSSKLMGYCINMVFSIARFNSTEPADVAALLADSPSKRSMEPSDDEAVCKKTKS